MPWSLLIRGGSVVDGSGAPARRADVAVEGDRIAAIGPANEVLKKYPNLIFIIDHFAWAVPGEARSLTVGANGAVG